MSKAVWKTNTRRCLEAEVDGGAANVDQAVEGVASAADGLRCAGTTRAESDGGDGRAASADVASEADNLAN